MDDHILEIHNGTIDLTSTFERLDKELIDILKQRLSELEEELRKDDNG